MTNVGKALVVLNMVMSFVFMGVALMVYTARVDLRGKIADQDKQRADLQSTLSKIEEDNAALNTSLEEQKTDLANVKARHGEEIAKLEKERDDLQVEITNQRKDAADNLRQMEMAVVEQTKRREMVERLRETRQDLLGRNATLVTENTRLDDELAKTKNAFELANSRNQQLLELVNTYQAYIKKKEGVLPPDHELARVERGTPPPPDVEGVVTRVDPQGRYIQISLGEDDGIQKDQILEVWRDRPTPKYLGKAKIFTTQPATAVAQPVNLAGPVQVNDRVGPRILMNTGN